MTTILCDPALALMVCDSNVSDGDQKWPEPKVERIDGALYGTCGDEVESALFLDWVRSGKKGRKPKLAEDAFNALELGPKGMRWYDNKLHGVKMKHPMAIGSGAKPARAALLALRLAKWQGDEPDVVQAVKLACEVDAQSGLPVQVYRLEGE